VPALTAVYRGNTNMLLPVKGAFKVLKRELPLRAVWHALCTAIRHKLEEE
jgi:hypothetical protein